MTRTYEKVKCIVDGCENTVGITYNSGEYCNKHRMQLRYGEPGRITMWTISKIYEEKDVVRVELLNKERVIDYAFIDVSDISKIVGVRWSKTINGYVYNKRLGFMHRVVMNLPRTKDGEITDHLNGNRVDNRKENLRICDEIENHQNITTPTRAESGYRGVRWSKYIGKWCAKINVNRNNINLGSYDNLNDAVHARQMAEEKYFTHKGGTPDNYIKPIKGIRFKDDKWEAQIFVRGKNIYLGRFSDEASAMKARVEAETLYRKKPIKTDLDV